MVKNDKKHDRNGEPVKADIFSDSFDTTEDDLSKTLTHKSVCKKDYDNCAKLETKQLVDISECSHDILQEGSPKSSLHLCKCQLLNPRRHNALLFENCFIQSDYIGYDTDKSLVSCLNLEPSKERNNNNDDEKVLQRQSSSIRYDNHKSPIIGQSLKRGNEGINNNGQEMLQPQSSCTEIIVKNNKVNEHKQSDTSNNNIPNMLNVPPSTIKHFSDVRKEDMLHNSQKNMSHVTNRPQFNILSNNLNDCKHQTFQHKVSQCKYGGCKPSRYNVPALHDKVKYGEGYTNRDIIFRNSYMDSDGERPQMTAPYTSKTFVENEINESSIYQNSFANLDNERPRLSAPHTCTSNVFHENEVNKGNVYRIPHTNLDGEQSHMTASCCLNTCPENDINKSSIYRNSYTNLDDERSRMATSYSSTTFCGNDFNNDGIFRTSYTNVSDERPGMIASHNLSAYGENDTSISKSNIYQNSYTNFDKERLRMTMPYSSSIYGENAINKDSIFRSSYTNLDGEQPRMTTLHTSSSNICAGNDLNKDRIYRSPRDGERPQMTAPYSFCSGNDINKSSIYRSLFTNLDGERPSDTCTMSHDGQEYAEEKKSFDSYRYQFNMNNVGAYRGPGICKPPDNLGCFHHGLSNDSVYKKDYRNYTYDLYGVPMHYGNLKCLTNSVTPESVCKRDYKWPFADSERRLQKYFPTSKLKSNFDCKSQLVPLYSPYNLKTTPGFDSSYRREYNTQTGTIVPDVVKSNDNLKFGPGKISDMTIYRNDYRKPSHYDHYPFKSQF